MLTNALKGLRTSYPWVSRGEQITQGMVKFYQLSSLICVFEGKLYVRGEAKLRIFWLPQAVGTVSSADSSD